MAFSHPIRRKVVEMLSENELTVGELAEPFKVSMPAMSQHLQVLRKAKVVRQRRLGRQRVYRLNPGPIREVAEWSVKVAEAAEQED
ncbi:MAG: metalloregulator ArsR/SmtB family transcription factor [Planctomycetota bacterium]